MRNGTEKYIETVRYLGKLYDCLNGELFAGELDKPVITVQADEKNKAYGWFTLKKVWKETAEDEGTHEINISAQFLNRPVKDIAETMLHEMCHQYAKLNGIQDCSRSGSYHNKLFKRIAETHGLTVECVKVIGWSHTELTEESTRLIETFVAANPESIIYRVVVEKGSRVSTSSTRKYVCPICGQSVRATKAVNIICADCDAAMVEE